MKEQTLTKNAMELYRKAPAETKPLVDILHQAFLGFQSVNYELVKTFTTDPYEQDKALDYDYHYGIFSAMYKGIYDNMFTVLNYWNGYYIFDSHAQKKMKKELKECIEITISMMTNAKKALFRLNETYVLWDEESLLQAFRYFSEQMEYVTTIYRLTN